MISVGAYHTGSDPEIDDAIAMHPLLTSFLQQGMNQSVPLQTSVDMLHAIGSQRHVQEKSITPAPHNLQLANQGQKGNIIAGN